MTELVFAIEGEWALKADELQWMLCKRASDRGKLYWRPVSFVRLMRDILARCMREKATPADVAAKLLLGLPDTFDEWKTNHVGQEGICAARVEPPIALTTLAAR